MLRGEGVPRALLALAVVLSATWVVFACYRPSGTIDLWWTLRVGDHIRAHGEVPRTTRWTMDAVRDLPYISHGWASALAYSSVKDAFGLDAVPAVPTLLALAVFGAVAVLARGMGASWLLSVTIAVLVLYPVLPRMRCRAESFGYLCFAVSLHVVAAWLRTRRPRTLLWLVPLAVVWVNVHGSFMILLGLPPLLGAGMALDAWRRSGFRADALLASVREVPLPALGGVWLGVGAATLLNPYGLDLIPSTIDQSTSRLWAQVIAEWKPIYRYGRLPMRFVLPAAALLLAVGLGHRRLSFASMLLAGACAALAVSSYRHLALLGLGSALLLAEFARGIELGARPRAIGAAALCALLLAANSSAAQRWSWEERSLERHPSPLLTEKSLRLIQKQLRGNVLNDWTLGGLLIYFAYPHARVAIDSRADPYPPAYFRAWWRALSGSAEDTLAFVDRYDIDHIVVEQRTYTAQLEPKLAELEGFRVAFADGRIAILSRERPDPAAQGAAEGP